MLSVINTDVAKMRQTLFCRLEQLGMDKIKRLSRGFSKTLFFEQIYEFEVLKFRHFRVLPKQGYWFPIGIPYRDFTIVGFPKGFAYSGVP